MVPRFLAVLCAISAAAPLRAQTEYPLTTDSERQAGVPAGKVTAHRFESRVFPGTVRDYWVYVPAQYRPDTPAAVMVFQDGGGYVKEDGRWRAPIVFDNLIHKGESRSVSSSIPACCRPPPATRPSATTGASSTTRSATAMPGSCWRSSCPRSARA